MAADASFVDPLEEEEQAQRFEINFMPPRQDALKQQQAMGDERAAKVARLDLADTCAVPAAAPAIVSTSDDHVCTTRANGHDQDDFQLASSPPLTLLSAPPSVAAARSCFKFADGVYGQIEETLLAAGDPFSLATAYDHDPGVVSALPQVVFSGDAAAADQTALASPQPVYTDPTACAICGQSIVQHETPVVVSQCAVVMCHACACTHRCDRCEHVRRAGAQSFLVVPQLRALLSMVSLSATPSPPSSPPAAEPGEVVIAPPPAAAPPPVDLVSVIKNPGKNMPTLLSNCRHTQEEVGTSFDINNAHVHVLPNGRRFVDAQAEYLYVGIPKPAASSGERATDQDDGAYVLHRVHVLPSFINRLSLCGAGVRSRMRAEGLSELPNDEAADLCANCRYNWEVENRVRRGADWTRRVISGAQHAKVCIPLKRLIGHALANTGAGSVHDPKAVDDRYRLMCTTTGRRRQEAVKHVKNNALAGGGELQPGRVLPSDLGMQLLCREEK